MTSEEGEQLRLKGGPGESGVGIWEERILGVVEDYARIQPRREPFGEHTLAHGNRTLDRDVTKVQDAASIVKISRAIMASAMVTADAHYRRARALLGLLLVVLHGCATPPPVVVPVAPSTDEQLSWILRLEDQRKLADPAPAPPPVPVVVDEDEDAGSVVVPAAPLPPRPDLIGLARDGAPHLRRRAALAIGRVGLSDGVDPLVALLSDPEAEVRQMAAFSLGLIGDAAATQPLVDGLDDLSPRVQGRAAQALSRIGATAAAPAIGVMVQRHVTSAFGVDPEDLSYPQRDEVEAFRLGIYALGELKAFDPLAEAVLGDGGQPILWWWPVAYALGRTEDPRALPALATLSGVQGSVGVALAAQGLGALGVDRAVEPLTELLDLDRRGRPVVVSAIRALGETAMPAAAAALDRFVRIRSLDQRLRLATVDALAKHSSAASVEVFTELLAHPWPPLRAASLRALAHTDPEGFMFILSGLESDADWRVRAALAEGLRWVRPEAARYRLTLMLNDADQRVIPAVLESLVAVGAPEIARILQERLQVPDVVVRKTAARLVGELRLPEAEQALVDAYDAAEPDPSYLARAAVLDALAEYGAEASTDTLRRALSDRDWAVRIRAAEHLERLAPGATHDDIRPAPGLRRVDYASSELINPSVSPHVYIETVHGTIEIELAVLDAPLTSENFMTLARQGFYDGLTFHRIVPNYVAQTGDPRSDSEGGPGYTLRDELSELPFLRGTVGMARDWADTGGSQFFITHSPQPQLDGRYTAFGRVVAGMEVVDRLQPGDRIDRVLVWDGTQPFGQVNPR